MKNKKFIRLGSVLLFSATFATIPLIATSCAATTIDAKQAFKNKISTENMDITQEAIDVLGTDLYRQENGMDVLDVSHWKSFEKCYGLNEFNKPVNKIILPINNYDRSFYPGAFYPKFEEIENKKIEDIYIDFKLKGEVRFQTSYLYLVPYKIKNNAFLTEENKERLGAFPLQAFHNVTKIVFDLKYKSTSNIYYASLPNAFRTYDENDPHLVEFQGRKYPGIVASSKEMFRVTLGTIIPFWEGGGEDQYLKIVSGDYKLTPFPGFREFYWALKGQEDMKIYIRSIPEFEAILNLEYKQYAIDNADDVIAQQNFVNLKTLLEWDGESYIDLDNVNF